MDAKNIEKEQMDIDTAIAYAQVAIHTLEHSSSEITDRSIKNEMKMLQQKFGTKEVKRLSEIYCRKKK